MGWIKDFLGYKLSPRGDGIKGYLDRPIFALGLDNLGSHEHDSRKRRVARSVTWLVPRRRSP